MKKEKSCGSVIYKIEGNSILFLISTMSLGHVSLTKGHVENNETEVETAIREIKEETNLSPEIDAGFRKVITYSPKAGVMKDVVFFVAKCFEDTKPIDLHDEEVEELAWKDFGEAISLLTFESDRSVLEAAYEYIRGKENGKF